MSNTDHPPAQHRIAPRSLILAGLVALGVLAGLSAFTVGYGGGLSYLSDDPAACANCHVMQDHLDTWERSSHRRVATCNDCHLSHHPVGRWVTKADNGFFHSLAFTTGDFPEPIRIKPRNRAVTKAACLHCHAQLFDHHPAAGPDPVYCVQCHARVGHAGRGLGVSRP